MIESVSKQPELLLNVSKDPFVWTKLSISNIEAPISRLNRKLSTFCMFGTTEFHKFALLYVWNLKVVPFV